MAAHVEEFHLPVSTDATESACHRALRSPDWDEQASATLTVEVPVSAGQPTPSGADVVVGIAIALLERVRFTRRHWQRATTLAAEAPAGPADASAEIYAVWTSRVVVRISLREAGVHGADVTISGAGLRGIPVAVVRSAIRELRRSIEIQSGSLTPYQPPQGS
jgi:hypothetical protein